MLLILTLLMISFSILLINELKDNEIPRREYKDLKSTIKSVSGLIRQQGDFSNFEDELNLGISNTLINKKIIKYTKYEIKNYKTLENFNFYIFKLKDPKFSPNYDYILNCNYDLTINGIFLSKQEIEHYSNYLESYNLNFPQLTNDFAYIPDAQIEGYII